MKLPSRLIPDVKTLFLFDIRSLGLMRVAVAITLLVDLLIRLKNLEAHYSNEGVLPLEALFRYAWNNHYFSIYSITGSIYIQFIVFLINMICAFFLLIGYRTRLFTILCWIFLVSIHNRNPLVHQGGDDLLRLLLFWGIFLPWGNYLSIDEKTISTPQDQFSIISLAGFFYMLQVGYVYFFSALLKSSPEWNTEFTAIYYAFSIDQIVMPMGKFLYPYEGFLKMLTAIVYYTEYYLPFILLVPYFSQFFRNIFIAGICMLHIGIACTLNVGLFPMIGIVSLIGLLPGSLSEKISGFFSPVLYKIYLGKLKYLFENREKVQVQVYKETFYLKCVLLIVGLYIFNWNLVTIKRPNLVEGEHVSWLGNLLRIDQHWGMFSPGVFKDDGWFIFEARRSNEQLVDILQNGSDVSYKKFAAVSAPFTEDRWRKYSENILFVSNAMYRDYYCRYLLRQWNQHRKQEQINLLKIVYMKEISLAGYKVKGPTREVLCECGR